MERIVHAVRHAPSLPALVFRDEPLNDAGVVLVSQAIGHGLAMLSLSLSLGGGVSDDGMKVVSEASDMCRPCRALVFISKVASLRLASRR
mmetsp:Transcript_90584/g.242621  ORF Transcript_90584/g.242621 Transcript_90584/m.242621 type:complete len:90 (-) Transcript_90584:462-731(-)